MNHSEVEMANRSVISVHTKQETAKRLDQLASLTRRSKSFLANEAIERYLKEEEAFIASVQQGQADVAAEQTFTTDEMREQIKNGIERRTNARNT